MSLKDFLSLSCYSCTSLRSFRPLRGLRSLKEAELPFSSTLYSIAVKNLKEKTLLYMFHLPQTLHHSHLKLIYESEIICKNNYYIR